jgi:hypothetical protein
MFLENGLAEQEVEQEVGVEHGDAWEDAQAEEQVQVQEKADYVGEIWTNPR